MTVAVPAASKSAQAKSVRAMLAQRLPVGDPVRTGG
jgi:hypothetical protein